MITRLWEWLNRSLSVSGDWSQIDTWKDTEVLPTDYQSKVDDLKNQMGPSYLLHYSNRVQRKDGKTYGRKQPLKLRKV